MNMKEDTQGNRQVTLKEAKEVEEVRVSITRRDHRLSMIATD